MNEQYYICPVCGRMDLCSHCAFCGSNDMLLTKYVLYHTPNEAKIRAINEYVRDLPTFDETKCKQRMKEEKDWEEGKNPNPYWQTPEWKANWNKHSDDEESHQPKCPVCGSTNIHKISAANKVGAAAVFGVFAIGHVSKTYKCDNCGAKF